MKEITRYLVSGSEFEVERHPDGDYVEFDDLDAISAAKDARIADLQEQVRELAAEAGRMKKAIKQVFPLGVDDENGKIGFSGIAKECYASALETAATDAALREIRAQGAIEARNALVVADDGADIYAVVTDVAARIRAGEQP